MKPSPGDAQDLVSGKLCACWVSTRHARYPLRRGRLGKPDLGAWGLGWEVWCDGMEVTSSPISSRSAAIDCDPVPVELTYGLERLAMYVQGVENVYDLDWDGHRRQGGKTYGDVFSAGRARILRPIISSTRYRHGAHTSRTPKPNAAVLAPGTSLALPAYDQCLKASHLFNLLDARGVISVTERQAYIGRVRALAKGCAEAWMRQHNALGEEGCMPELLLEILSEEIPARMQARAADDLKRLVTEGLKAAGSISQRGSVCHAAPLGAGRRRPAGKAARRVRRKTRPERQRAGTRPSTASRGSLPEGAVIEERETPKGEFLFALVDTKGRRPQTF